uniref:hypothetical protein n=1 Tax=Lactococcus taiwanensis TaxID=1151742 RepID=UPI0028A6EAC0|nr:hypothetical protein [Lactococcus taiwanensis]
MSSSTYTFVSNADRSFKVTGKGTSGYEVLSKSFPAKVGDKLRFTVRYTNRLAFGLYNNLGLQFVVNNAYTESVTSTSKIVLPNTITALTEYQLEYTATASNVWMQLNFGGVADSSQVDFDIEIEVENLTNPVKYVYMGTYTDTTITDSKNYGDYAWFRIKGIDGKDGVGIKATDITYAISTSGTTAPTTGWTSSVPSLVKGQYLWTKTVWTYTDNSSETGYSVTYISKDGNNGDPGKVVSDTEPTTLFKGLTWKYSATADLTASDGTVILSGTEYYWSGTNWILSEINAHNINVDDLSAISTTLTNGKFISNWSSDNATGTTTIEKNHLIINSANASLNTKNTIALDNEQGMMMTYTNTINKRMISAGVNFQGLFVTDSTGPYVSVTPTGIVNSVDVPWTSIGTYADYKRDGNVVTIRVVDAITTTAGNITLGRIPSKDGPVEAVMGPAIAWSSANTNDKHLQINAASGGATVTILNAVANQKYKFQFSYQI